MKKIFFKKSIFLFVSWGCSFLLANAKTVMIKDPPQRNFVIITASYNNEKWVRQNLASIFSQDYPNFRVIYWDDCSTDNTLLLVNKFIKEHHLEHKIKVMHNKKRVGPHCNIYRAIYSCKDTEIIVIVDGDDWLAHDKVLSKLNTVYTNHDVWLTYGSYINYMSKKKGICRKISKEVIANNSFRACRFRMSHLRTFYAWLYKRIKKEDLLFKGKFIRRCGDLAIMFPMLEMAGIHSRFISSVLLVYNDVNEYSFANPIGKVFASDTYAEEVKKYLRTIAPYAPLDLFDACHYGEAISV